MGRFDGVALLGVIGPGERARAAGRDALIDRLEAHPRVLLPGHGLAQVRRPFGFPHLLPADGMGDVTGAMGATDGRLDATAARDAVVVLAGLVAVGELAQGGTRSLADPVDLADLHGRTAAGPWSVGAVALVPPARTGDLQGCRPLDRGRTHVGRRGQAMTLCGRLPLRGDPVVPGAVDCLRCLRSDELSARHDRQVAHHGALVELAGPLTAGVADRLWQRLAHRDAAEVPALLDAMVGAIMLGVPGAPTAEATLVQIRRQRAVASGPVQRWAAAEARERLTRGLIRSAATHPVHLDPDTRERLAVAADLVDPAETAEVVVRVLEEHGPAPALEPIALHLAERAGDAASPRVDRWRRIHAVARALAGTPS